MKRILAIGIILLFIGMSISSSTGFNAIERTNTISTNGKTLYVGGSGPGNYSKIQDAIDNASDGDTVFVYEGCYFENLIVDKSIRLIGEDRNSTIIDAHREGDVIAIHADFVNLKGFKIINSGSGCMGIQLNSNYNYIANNNIKYNDWGIRLEWFISNYNIIYRNNISYNSAGLFIPSCNNNNISENIIYLNYNYGISLYSSGSNNIVSRNKIMLNTVYGIKLKGDPDHKNDSFVHNYITNNVFIENGKDARIYTYNFISIISNTWRGNYWNKPRFLPKLIVGLFWNKGFNFPIFNVDWHPAQEPYDIEV